MEIILGVERIRRSFRNPVAALGNFDGVHLGHQLILERTRGEAGKIGGESLVFTFEPHPLKVLRGPDCPPLITPFKKKLMLIEGLGVDVVICATFTRRFSAIGAREFVESVLVDRIGIRKIVVGYNYCFGFRRQGTVEDLRRYGREFGFQVIVVGPVRIGGRIVSSSVIRGLIQQGEVAEVARFLGRYYMVLGKVIWGTARGRLLGVPTANVEILNELYPKNGVYAVRVLVEDQTYGGVANVGMNPTFGGDRFSLEVHIFDFHQDIYGKDIQVAFIERIRSERAFNSPEALVEQIQRDMDQARRILASERFPWEEKNLTTD
ncbi:MAG: bifunctional riboflavin kinase/FAD synthetase [Deltaproteobacteria bacterium]|nr:bifunctional riboflavin kinase/FAD synthetase [Deltaproteobacteria bacterium]